jgi:hypothetical protein
LGVEKDYKTALEKEMANTARAKANASSIKFTDPIFHKEWNPSVYDAGELVGTIGAPIPGAQVAGAAIRGTGMAAKAGRGLVDAGVNLGTMYGAEWLKNRTDKNTTGGVTQPLVDKMAQMTPQQIQAIQKNFKVPTTGKLDVATLDAVAKSGMFNETSTKISKPITEAERMAVLRSRLDELNKAEQMGIDEILRTVGITSKKELVDLLTKDEMARVLAGGSREEMEKLASIAKSRKGAPSTTTKPSTQPRTEPSTQPNTAHPNDPAHSSSSASSSSNGNQIHGSGNSTNTNSVGNQTMSPVFNIHINGSGPITAVEQKAAPEVIAGVEKEACHIGAAGLAEAADGGGHARRRAPQQREASRHPAAARRAA